VVEIIFLMLVLKLPILYLIGVVWWAVRAEPRPAEPAALTVPAADDPRRFTGRPGPRRPRRGGPHDRGRAPRRAARSAPR
jgi:hypothetical protein